MNNFIILSLNLGKQLTEINLRQIQPHIDAFAYLILLIFLTSILLPDAAGLFYVAQIAKGLIIYYLYLRILKQAVYIR
jgi:hypothetical protein